ncbi:MAG: hypothetical protein NXY57DRAFT_903259 [Lentinula lateritia]|nr:MAG: hypothetical protein NXY57DRAFT_903259 [Lentinula lateritia]
MHPLPAQQRQRAVIPKFPVDIQPRTFKLAKAHLLSLNYEGPVALSCDDTKLQEAFRPFYDEDRKGWCILGSSGVPILIADPDEFRKVVKEGKIEKASKLRLYCMQICCPGVPACILAAVAIPSTLSAPELFRISDKIICGLLAEDILLCSYSCDGTSSERNVQHLLEQSADSTLTHYIHDPRSGFSSITIPIPIFSGQPIANIQDDLHLLKTMRNNAFSGARLLVFPNSVVMYSQVREIAFKNGPIYKRDVVKLDRQDDNAAARLFSASTVDWLSSEMHRSEENIGLLVYIFVFGELVDAFQSRTASLIDRVRMVLRAYFFLDLWEQFLDAAGYPKTKYFLSRESLDIIHINIRGFFQMLFIHRDHLPRQYALFLHLLGTSICEHVFGFSRLIDPDFTMYSWYVLKPKITLMLRNAILCQQSKDGKARASGYNHSYLDRHGINIIALSSFPSDADINEGSKAGWADAVSLFALLGSTPEELAGSLSLPSISSWFRLPLTVSAKLDNEDEYGDSECSDSDNDSEPDPSLQTNVDTAEDLDPDTDHGQHRLMSYRFAAIALEINKDMTIGSLPEEDEQMIAESISNDIECIGEMLAASLPAINHVDPARPDFPSLDQVDLTQLYRIRKAHETRLAASATRQTEFSKSDDSKVNGQEKSTLSAEAELRLAFQQIINEESKKDRGEGTGSSR